MTDGGGALNRTVLTLIGLGLAGTGATIIARGLGAFGVAVGHETVLGPQTLTAIGNPTSKVAAVAGAVIVALLCLRWLLAQVPRRHGGELQLEKEPHQGTTHVAVRTLTKVVERDIVAYRGVRSARAVLTGSSCRPKLDLLVTADAPGDLHVLRRRIREGPVVHLSEALQAQDVVVQLLFTVVPARSRPT